jgi:hypothetical protein
VGKVVTTKPIADRAEVALEYSNNLYNGIFERSSLFEASMDTTGLFLVVEHRGSEDVRKSVHVHINYGLLSDILQQVSTQVSKIPADQNSSRSTASRGRWIRVSFASSLKDGRDRTGGRCTMTCTPSICDGNGRQDMDNRAVKRS